MRFVYLLMLTLFVSFVLPSSVKADISITVKPSRVQQMFVRGNLYYACTSTGNLFQFLEQPQSVVDMMNNIEGCGAVPMTAVTRRNDYVTSDGRLFQVYRFLVNGWDFYTYDQTKWRRWRRY